MINTITQAVVEDRLQPARHTPKQFSNGKTLLRSSSFYKLREFPAYLCRKGSSDVIHWLLNSSTKLSCLLASHERQARKHLMLLSVYLVLLVLLVEIGVLFLVLVGSPCPPGLIFLSFCVGAMAYLATILSRPHIERLQSKLKK